MKSNKKGFTIVELVIVIAIIAILAAVLIPTFASLVKKANVSADTQLVRNLNMAVEIEKASSNAKHETMHEALMTAQAAGYDVDTIVAKSGYNIAWDSANDRFVLVDKDAKKYIYPTSENTAENSISNPADYFLFCDDSAKIDESGFSYYLSKNAKLPENGVVAVKAGFDAGENKNLKEVTYEGNATKVIFNLNGGKLTVNDKTDSNQQYFYGSLAEAVVSTGNSCFHAYGTIAKLDLQAGKVVAEAGSIVMVSNAVSGTEVAKSSGSVVMTTSDAKVENGATVVESTADEKSAYVLEISDAAGLAAFRDSVNAGMTYEGLTVKLTADIDLGNKNWLPIGNYREADGFGKHTFNGTFDGQNHTISGLFIDGDNYPAKYKDKDSVYGALFGYICNATLKNFTVKGVAYGTDVAGVVGALDRDCTVDNVTSYVDLVGMQGENESKQLRGKIAGIALAVKGKNVNISNCTNNGKIKTTAVEADTVGGIVAIAQADQLTITGCTNNAEITAPAEKGVKGVAGIVGSAINNGTHVTITTCKNSGEITASNNAIGATGAYIGFIGQNVTVTVDGEKVTGAK